MQLVVSAKEEHHWLNIELNANAGPRNKFGSFCDMITHFHKCSFDKQIVHTHKCRYICFHLFSTLFNGKCYGQKCPPTMTERSKRHVKYFWFLFLHYTQMWYPGGLCCIRIVHCVKLFYSVSGFIFADWKISHFCIIRPCSITNHH